jgi:alanine racemase
MPRPLVATIDITAMQSNLEIARRLAPAAKLMAVVKANAYGHGLMQGMQGFAAADGLALIELDAAVRLRDAGWKKKILLLEGFFEPADLRTIQEYQLDTTVHCIEQLEMLEKNLPAQPIDVHLKMNSGMNRLGFKPAAFRESFARLRKLSAVRDITFMTHFANAENEFHEALPLALQVQRFNEATHGLQGARSLANSATDLLHPELAADWVRPGVMLYGGTPGARSAQQFGLRPAMSLTSEIIGVQDVARGDSVGYGSLFVADAPMKVGVVACGYADGYPRHAPTGTPVIVDGVRTRILGRVSMDMMSVDLTDIPGARVGSRVMLWGTEAGVALPIDEVAQAAGTIGYELMCALAPRVRLRVI